MDGIREKITMGRYIYYVVAVILLLCGLIYLLSSCTTEIDDPDGGKGGKKKLVAVNFSMAIGSYNNDEIIGNRSVKTKERVSDFARVVNDIYLHATLEEEHPVTTRGATTNLPDGTFVRIVAYDDSATPVMVDSATYVVAPGGDLTPAVVGQGINVPDNNDYIFVAYSLNSYSIPSQSNIDFTFNASSYTDLDLLWGKTSAIHITASSIETVDIQLYHLFSRVRVEATTSAIINPSVNINEFSSTHVSPHYGGLTTLNVLSGNLTPNTGNNPGNLFLTQWKDKGAVSFGADNTLNSQNVESDYAYIFTNKADEIALIIQNLKVGGIDLGDYKFRFTKKLLPGHSYTLKLNFKRLVWAGSNIFWDGTKLTFFPESTPEIAQGYQGVLFLWGSLIGISPKGNFDNTSTILYVPNSPTTWSNTQRAVSGNDWLGTTMTDIPHIKTGTYIVTQAWLDNHTSRNYLADEAHDPVSRTGDICQYLTERGDAPHGEWRMPNSREFGYAQSEYTFNINHSWNRSIVNDDGTTNFYSVSSYIKKNASRTIFPAGGDRDQSGIMSSGGTTYQSGSPVIYNNTSTSGIFDAYWGMDTTMPSFVYFSYPRHLGTQGPVRCVKIDDSGAITFDEILPVVDEEDWEPGGTFGGSSSDTAGQGDVWY